MIKWINDKGELCMALGILKIVFFALIILVAIGQFALYKNRWRQGTIIGNTILGVIISYMAFTSLPSNYTGQRGLALVWGVVALVAFVLDLRSKDTLLLSKILLTISVIGGIIQLFI